MQIEKLSPQSLSVKQLFFGERTPAYKACQCLEASSYKNVIIQVIRTLSQLKQQAHVLVILHNVTCKEGM